MRTTKTAIIDLGTNTFHLLIVEQVRGQPFTELYRKRFFVKLAAEGIVTLGEESMTRGLLAMHAFSNTINTIGVASVRAVGTSALRTASNGAAFLLQIKEATGISVKIIDGQDEATLIYRGVRQVWKIKSFPALIMDIGGGSVEFIIADQEKMIWKDSFPIGVAVLHRRFHHSDPIDARQIKEIKLFLHPYLTRLQSVLTKHKPSMIVGASGTFDVIAGMLQLPRASLFGVGAVSVVREINQYILSSTTAQRRDDPLIPDSRIDMIVVAIVLLEHVLDLHPFSQIGVSAYALKEGLLDS